MKPLFSKYQRELSAAIAFAALLLVVLLVAPNFYSFGNLRDLALSNAAVLLIALGMTLVILLGEIDISVGSQFAVLSILAGTLAKAGLPLPLLFSVLLICGALLGAVNAALVAWLRIPSIVVTLAAMVAWRDGLRWVTEGAWVQGLPASFQWFGLGQAAGQAVILVLALALSLGLHWMLQNVAAGRAVYAVGSDAEAARLAGIHPQRVTFTVFVLLGAFTALAALLNSIRFYRHSRQCGRGAGTQSHRRRCCGRDGDQWRARDDSRHADRRCVAGHDWDGADLCRHQSVLGKGDSRRDYSGGGLRGCCLATPGRNTANRHGKVIPEEHHATRSA
jgi:rhamnose transport system permease protein